MKKYILLVITIICITLLSGCTKSDASKFKEDYESLNKVELNGITYRSVTIDEDNPFVYTTGEEIVKKIENKETFYLYVGDTRCPWCRSVIEMAIKKAKEYNIETIYYINIWDQDYNEIFRDKYKLDEKGNLLKVDEGTESYKKLLKYFESSLRDYTLTDNNGKKVEVGEKRIYAPYFFYVKKGLLNSLTSGKSDKQTDPIGELTEEILKEEEKLFNEFFKPAYVCSPSEC